MTLRRDLQEPLILNSTPQQEAVTFEESSESFDSDEEVVKQILLQQPKTTPTPIFQKAPLLTRPRYEYDWQTLTRATLYIEDATHHRDMERRQDATSLKAYKLYHRLRDLWLFRALVLIHLLCALFEPPQTWTIPNGVIVAVIIVCLVGYSLDLFFKGIFCARPVLKDPLNLILLIAIVLSFADLIVWAASEFQIVLRLGQYLRPIFMICFFPQIRACLKTVVMTVPATFEFFILLAFVLSFSLVLFVIIFKNIIPSNFGNYWLGFISLFVLFADSDNYPDVMIPAYNQNYAVAIPFIIFVVVTVFIGRNLFLAVIYNAYKEEVENVVRKGLELEDRLLKITFDILDIDRTGSVSEYGWVQLFKHLRPSFQEDKVHLMFKIIDEDNNGLIQFKEFKRIIELLNVNIYSIRRGKNLWYRVCPTFYKNRCTKKIRHFIQSGWFMIATDILIVITAVYVGVSESSASDYATLSVLEYIFIAVSCTEVLLKIFALGFTRYFQSHWNKIDCFLIVTSLLEVAIFSYLSGEWKPQIFRLLLGLRMIRLVRWFTKIERFKVIMATVSQMLVTMVTFAGALFVVYYWFAALGMQLWAGEIRPDRVELQDLDYARNEYWNLSFNNFIEAMSLLFSVILNNWHSIAQAVAAISSWYAWIYFVLWMLVTALVLMSALTAFILDAFIVQWNIKKRKWKGYVQWRIEQLCSTYSVKDEEGIFYDGEHKKVWRAKPRFDVFQIMRTVAEDGENFLSPASI